MRFLSDPASRPFWLITFTAAIALVLSQLIQDGAFMDGMLYVSVSKNLADGIGTFWNPHFCKAYQSSFHEQPPLYFGLLALFYKVFGTSLYVERLFCFTCFTITGIYIHKLWKKIALTEDVSKNSWLPVLLWMSIPICFWAYTNMVEEVVMSMFVIIAACHAFRALFRDEQPIPNLLLSGLFIFLAFLTKGVQGTFLLVAAAACRLVTRRFSFAKMLLYTLILAGVPLLFYFLLVKTNPAAAASFSSYFEGRLTGTFKNTNDTTDTHFFLLGRLLSELLPALLISSVLRFALRKKAQEGAAKEYRPVMLWLLLIGLAGSLPLMITLEQRSFYLVTSLPFFALALALFTEPYLATALQQIRTKAKGFRIFSAAAGLLLAAALVFCMLQVGKAKRDGAMLQDVYLFGTIIPHGEVIGLPQEMCYDFNFKEYLVRYFYISSDDHNHTNEQHTYFICRKDLSKDHVPGGYKPYPLQTREFDLYKK